MFYQNLMCYNIDDGNQVTKHSDKSGRAPYDVFSFFEHIQAEALLHSAFDAALGVGQKRLVSKAHQCRNEIEGGQEIERLGEARPGQNYRGENRQEHNYDRR